MGQLAEDMLDGFMCSGCGVCFVKEHGYPVLCAACYEQAKKEKHIHHLRKAIHPEV